MFQLPTHRRAERRWRKRVRKNKRMQTELGGGGINRTSPVVALSLDGADLLP